MSRAGKPRQYTRCCEPAGLEAVVNHDDGQHEVIALYAMPDKCKQNIIYHLQLTDGP